MAERNVSSAEFFGGALQKCVTQFPNCGLDAIAKWLCKLRRSGLAALDGQLEFSRQARHEVRIRGRIFAQMVIEMANDQSPRAAGLRFQAGQSPQQRHAIRPAGNGDQYGHVAPVLWRPGGGQFRFQR